MTKKEFAVCVITVVMGIVAGAMGYHGLSILMGILYFAIIFETTIGKSEK